MELIKVNPNNINHVRNLFVILARKKFNISHICLPTYHQHKTTQEKIYRAIEMSGVLGLPGDINFMTEVISEGMFRTPIGIRPMLGTPGRFGEANVADATGEFIGAGPGMLADLIYAFREDLPCFRKQWY